MQKKVSTWKMLTALVVGMLTIFLLSQMLDNAFKKNAHRILVEEYGRIKYTYEVTVGCRETLRTLMPIGGPDLNREIGSLSKYCFHDLKSRNPNALLRLMHDKKYPAANWYIRARRNGIGGTWYMETNCVLNGPAEDPNTKRCLTINAAVTDKDGTFRKDPLTGEELGWRPMFDQPFCCVSRIPLVSLRD